MKRKKKAIVFQAGALMISAALLGGCGAAGDSTSSGPPNTQTSEMTASSEINATETELGTNADSAELTALREKAAQAGAACAIIDLGSLADESSKDSGIAVYSRARTQEQAYSFLNEIDTDHIIDSENGTWNAFCLVPAERGASVTVYESSLGDDGTLVKGNVLYTASDGAPIILRCTAGDVFTSERVSVDTSAANLTDYGPSYSGKDGSLILEDDSGSVVFDATIYEEKESSDSPSETQLSAD